MSTKQRDIESNHVSFEEFERFANRRCIATTGVTFDDLPDVDWFDVFEEGHYTRQDMADMADELISRAMSY